jgi:hypothetical protein
MGHVATLKAICIRCGTAKNSAPIECPKCGFAPTSDPELAKSFILSTAFDVGERSFGRSPADLMQISNTISAGTPYQFSDAEVAAVESQVAAFKSITPRRLAVDLLKWLGLPLLILAVAYALLRTR